MPVGTNAGHNTTVRFADVREVMEVGQTPSEIEGMRTSQPSRSALRPSGMMKIVLPLVFSTGGERAWAAIQEEVRAEAQTGKALQKDLEGEEGFDFEAPSLQRRLLDYFRSKGWMKNPGSELK